MFKEIPALAEVNNPGDGLDDAKEGVRQGLAEDGVKQKKTQTIQHLLSDWTTAISKQPKIKQPGASDRGSKKEGQLITKVGI